MTISHAGYDNVTASLPSRQECLPLWAPLLYLNGAFPRSNVGLGSTFIIWMLWRKGLIRRFCVVDIDVEIERVIFL